MRLSDYLIQKVELKFRTKTALAETLGISRGTWDTGINENVWSQKSIDKINRYLLESGAGVTITPELYEYKSSSGPKSIRREPVHVTPTNGLLSSRKVTKKLSESALKTTFASFTPGCNPFLAIATCQTMPRLFEPSTDFDSLRESIFTALARAGLVVVFITPDDATSSRLRRDYANILIPGAENFAEGFAFLVANFLTWCARNNIADAERLASERIGLVRHNIFDVAGLKHVLSYTGIRPTHTGVVEAQAFEWGPAHEAYAIVRMTSDVEMMVRCYFGNSLMYNAQQLNNTLRVTMAERMQARLNHQF